MPELYLVTTSVPKNIVALLYDAYKAGYLNSRDLCYVGQRDNAETEDTMEKGWEKFWNAAQQHPGVMEASNNALDASRYKALRDPDFEVPHVEHEDCIELLCGDQLDAAIDAAIAEQKPE